MVAILDKVVGWYGLLALTHLFAQINLAHAEFIRYSKDKIDKLFEPKVGIVIPSYNEEYEDLKNCVESALNQDYPNLKVILVDDGSKDSLAFDIIKFRYKDDERFTAIRYPVNKGKRHAQKYAFDILDKEVDMIVTVDSDTIIAEDGVQNIVQKFKDKKIGAVTGNCRAIRNRGLLTRLIDGRYFSAFNQERGAQSLFGTVLCCSGVFSAYRSEIIRNVKDKYVNQRFLGMECTYGDDRYLTNLVLNEGYKVKYESKAHAITGVPNTIKRFLKQQIRWNKSFYRELIYTVKFVIKKPSNFHPYILYDLAIQTFLPFLLIFSLIYSVTISILISPIYLLQYVVVLCGIALLRAMYSFFRAKDYNLFLFPLYSFLHIFLLIPARLYAIGTLRVTKWGTR